MKADMQHEMRLAYKQQMDEKHEREKMEKEGARVKAMEMDRAAE